MPEIWLVIGMCAVILVPFIKRKSIVLPTLAALTSLFLALIFTGLSMSGPAASGRAILGTATSGMLAIDPFSQFFKILLILFTILIIVQWLVATRHETAVADSPDLLCLLLGATTGMALMASANNLLAIFIATEAASFPSYALAGFRKKNRKGSEGSLKYVIFGSAASAIMVYGMSLIYGVTGSLDLPTIASRTTELSLQMSPDGSAGHAIPPLLAVGVLALFAGFAFKLSAVPLHFWCPDVFQGAPTEITTFLSVASKGAAVCLLLRVLAQFGAATPDGSTLYYGLAVGVAILGGVTATWGNLVALHQTNIKRLLAYSSIAHAGYMLMAGSLVVFTAGEHGSSQDQVVGAILFYLLVYLFMNLGAFTAAAVIARHTGGNEDIREYAGMIRRSPILVVFMTIFMLSLFGMPALGGFMGKIYLATSMKAAGSAGLVLIAVLLINTLLSLYFYLRPVYYMAFVPDRENRPAFLPGLGGVLVMTVCAAAVFWTGILPGAPGQMAREQAVIYRAPLHQPHASVPTVPESAASSTTSVAASR